MNKRAVNTKTIARQNKRAASPMPRMPALGRLLGTPSLARIAKGLHVRAINYTNTAKSASKAGDLIETILNTAKADILNDIAEEFEHEAGR